MSLVADILAKIPANGCQLKDRRARFPVEHPEAIDTALVGLRASGRIRLIGSEVSRPCMQAIPDEPDDARLSKLTPEVRRERRRLRARAWNRANPERARQNNKRFMERRAALLAQGAQP